MTKFLKILKIPTFRNANSGKMVGISQEMMPKLTSENRWFVLVFSDLDPVILL